MHEDGNEAPPPAVAVALMQYRVEKLEEAVKRVEQVQEVQGKKLDDIPGFIARKFEEQAEAMRKNWRSRVNLALSALSAAAALVAASAPFWGHR